MGSIQNKETIGVAISEQFYAGYGWWVNDALAGVHGEKVSFRAFQVKECAEEPNVRWIPKSCQSAKVV